MPDEPTKRIEQELRAYANQRRAEASPPFGLHPVNRRMLQDEVARRIGSAEVRPKGEWLWLKLLWPRLALAGAVCLVGVVAVLQFIPTMRGPEYEMARTDPASRFGPTAPVPTPEAGAEPDVDQSLSSKRGDLLVESPARDAEVASESLKSKDVAPVAEPPVSVANSPPDSSPNVTMMRRYGLRPTTSRELTDTRTTAETLPPPSRPQPAAQPSAVAASVDELSQPMVMVLEEKASWEAGTRESGPTPTDALEALQSAGLPQLATSLARQAKPAPEMQGATFAFTNATAEQATQRFVQIDTRRRNFNSPPPPPVLRSFQLRQSGSQIEIVDADGSIYRGVLGEAEIARDERRTPVATGSLDRSSQVDSIPRAVPARPAREAVPAARFGLQFHVVGTNLSLNERVAFQGEMVTGTNVFGVSYVAGGQPRQPAVWTSPGAAATAPTGTPRQLVPLLRIRGQATVGDGTKLEINALPAAR